MSTIGRYVARLLLARVGILLLGLAALMLILEFLADSDQVIAGSDDVARSLLLYTVLRLPGIVAELIPIAALLGGLLTFAELARHSELAAIYAAGMSKARLALAVLPVAALIGGFQLVIEDQAQPVAVKELRAWGIGDYNSEGAEVWLRRGEDILRVKEIDAGQNELRGVTIFQRDAEGNFTGKIEAARARAENGSWTLFDVTRSTVGSPAVATEARAVWSGALDPADLGSLITNPRELPLWQLLRLARNPELGSQPAYRYQVWLHERIASPVTTVMLILLTVALANPPRGRATQGVLIMIGLAIGFFLWTFDGLVLNFGDLGLLPPMLAAWTPVGLIATTAISIVLHAFGPRPAARRRASAPPPIQDHARHPGA